MITQKNKLQLVTTPRGAPRPLSCVERRVALRWFRGKVTVRDVLAGRTRSRSGSCFAVVDGARHG